MIKKIIKIFIYLFFVLVFLFLSFVFYFYSSYEKDFTKKYDCIVVFGASVLPNKEPTTALYKRIKSALRLYENGVSDCIIATGYKTSYGISEAEVIKNKIKEEIKEDNILIDEKGVDTLQSIINLDKSKSYILVSSNYHLARIYILAKMVGIKDFSVYSMEPDLINANHLKHIFREFFALLYNLLEIFIYKRVYN